MLFLLSACSSDEQNGGEDDSAHKGIVLPEKVTQLDVAPESITGYVTIDSNPTRFDMILDSDSNTMVTSDIPVSFGEHTFYITFEYHYIGYETPLILATAVISTTISQQSQSISAQESNYDYNYDEDDDGFTNISELNNSHGPTDPTDPDSFPLVDETPPSVVVLPQGGTTVFTTPQTVELVCNDGASGSGCSAVYFSLDANTAPQATSEFLYSAPFTLARNTLLSYFAVDQYGNSSAIQTQQYNFNIVGPSVSATPRGGIYPAAQSVQLLCDSPCADIYYTIDGSQPSTDTQNTTSIQYSGVFTIAESLTLKYFAVDGNQISGPTITDFFTIDLFSPATTATGYDPACNPTTSDCTLYSQTSLTVELQCSDDVNNTVGSGCASTYVGINQSDAPNTYVVGNQINIATTTDLYFYSVDAAGRVETPIKHQRYVIDQTDPQISFDPPGGDYTGPQTVLLYCDDGVNGSGCSEISYTLVTSSGGTTTQIYDPTHSNPIEITSSSTLSVVAVDVAGNSSTQSSNYNINIPPNVSNPALSFTNRNGNDFTITWTPASDETTPQLQLQYQLYHSDTNNLNSVANVLANGTPYGVLFTRTIAGGVISETVSGVSNSLDRFWTVLVQDEDGNQSVYDAALPNGLGFLGLLDKEFDTDGIIVKDAIGGGVGWDTTKAITLDAQGRIVAVGESFDADNLVIMTLMRFLPTTGQLDTSFNSPQGFITFPSPSRGQAVAIDSQNRIIVAGTIDNRMTVWRFSDTGVLDTAGFNSPLGYITDAPTGTWSYGNAVDILATDEIMVAGRVYDFTSNFMTLWRIDASGTLVFTTNDSSATTQAAYGMAIADTGGGYKVAITGSSGTTTGQQMAIWMYDIDGNAITTFGNNGLMTFTPVNTGDTSTGYSIVFDPTLTKLLTTGEITDTDTRMSLWQFDITNNTLDSSFNSTGYVSFSDLATTRGQSMVLDTSTNPYKLLVTGRVGVTNSLDMITWRYQSNGSPDSSFNGSQNYIVHNSAAGGNRNDWGNDIAIDSDGKIIIGGQSESLSNNDMAIWRYR